jgi:hypothetical protein
LRSGRDADITDSDTLANEVEVDLHSIGGETDRADIVAVDKGGACEGAVKLMKKLTEPRSLSHAICHNAILGLSAGAGDDELLLRGLLRGPGGEVGAEENDVAGCGPVRVEATNPISVSIDHQLRNRRETKKEVKVEGAMKVAKDLLESCELGSRKVCM